MSNWSLRASCGREIPHACLEGWIEMYDKPGAVGTALAWALWKSVQDESCTVYKAAWRVEPKCR